MDYYAAVMTVEAIKVKMGIKMEESAMITLNDVRAWMPNQLMSEIERLRSKYIDLKIDVPKGLAIEPAIYGSWNEVFEPVTAGGDCAGLVRGLGAHQEIRHNTSPCVSSMRHLLCFGQVLFLACQRNGMGWSQLPKKWHLWDEGFDAFKSTARLGLYSYMPSGNLAGCYWKWPIYSWFTY